MTTDELFQKQMLDQLEQCRKTLVSMCFDVWLVGCF